MSLPHVWFDTLLREFNVAYLKNENNTGCLSALGPEGKLYICQKEGKGKCIIETFIKPNLKSLQGLKLSMYK